MDGNSGVENPIQPSPVAPQNVSPLAFQSGEESVQSEKKRLPVKLIIIIGSIMLLGGILAGVYFFIGLPKKQSVNDELKNEALPQPTTVEKTMKLSLEEVPINTLQKEKIAAAHNAFGFDLFKKFSELSTANTNFSPASIAIALSQMYQGADKETFTQMQKVLHYNDLTRPEINAGVKYLLESFAEKPLSNYGGFTLKVADSMWVSKTSGAINPEFSALLQKYYYSQLFSEDFDDPKTVDKINTWVSDATEIKIESILSKLSSNSPFVLANAVYFDAAWANKFDKEETTLRDFTLAEGVVKKVPTMSKAIITDYYEDEDVQSIILPYGSGDAEMVVLLPKKSFSSFLSSLTEDRVKMWEAKSEYALVNLYFPRFAFEYDPQKALVESLKSLGMTDAFSDTDSDFDLIMKKIYISEILHKATIEVTEDGTVAAAATAVIAAPGGGSPDIKEYTMDVNRPFVYIITHGKTNEILFMGFVADPE